jgi:hypothetical protein
MLQIAQDFPVTEEEYRLLEDKFDQLAHYQAWQLIRRNSRNNHTDEEEDIVQDIRVAMLRAGSYYKRQVYIEECLEKASEHVKDRFIKEIVSELRNLWKNKTRHGANRQKYGPHQEKLLEKIIKHHVPRTEQPSKQTPLRFDGKFKTYCKTITWNQLKSIGKKITREKVIRAGQVSLSEFDYLGA